ncbi:hypothetical protein CONPUDRAFT_151081 [Coniophora puteana RWD-64-598 SS2]|uniref:Uncharacterized protein n=1 Tax=Coniophora puteana (strain RWD-64-598) TaxID=741705 RepID=A0A5M3MZI3_CONPW|nr:uncharacterized protein CONPUDRAFT_151081 [Coniophora puteana RWD-64-598 SS2]EIW84031.1 hypothetical protein CONPUDRAFT_151081 [Coniophora puteana RWD-64-598 SS2]
MSMLDLTVASLIANAFGTETNPFFVGLVLKSSTLVCTTAQFPSTRYLEVPKTVVLSDLGIRQAIHQMQKNARL